MKPDKIKKLLSAELENKKGYPAHRDTFCGNCGGDINEGEDFIFLAGKKICTLCHADIVKWLEE